MFDPDLFRTAAIHHYFDREREGIPVPLRIAPAWTWWIFTVLGGVAFLTLILSMIIKVEVQGTGRGVLHIAGGARALVSQASGRVVRVQATSGSRVSPGELLVELDSAALQAQMMEADQALAQAEQLTRPTHNRLDRLVEAQIQETLYRRDAQKEQLTSHEQSIYLLKRKYASTEALSKNGLVSAITVEEAREALAQGHRNVNSARQAVMVVNQELASLRAKREGERLHNLQETLTLRTKRESLTFSLAQTRITACEAGIVDGLHVRVGDIVTAGQSLGHLLASGGPPKAFALLAERDRAQIHFGAPVHLEFEQFPSAEWGTLQASILRISESPISLAELHEIFGDEAKADCASYLVELAIGGGQLRPLARQPLQTGMGFQARYVFRRQRLFHYLFKPLRWWH
jgi:multidrug resistance efflux pump